MKRYITISTIVSTLVMLGGIYAIIAGGSLEGANTTISKEEVEGAYMFFGGIMVVGSILNIIMIRIALNKSAVREQS